MATLDLTTVTWVSVKNFNGYYVNNFGEIVSHKHRRPRVLSQCIDADGYKIVGLARNGKMYTRRVHRLVAEAFIPNPDNLPCVNHKDEDKTNNRVDNLEWCTVRYNNVYGSRLKRVFDKEKKPVIQLSLDGVYIAEYESITQASNFTNTDKSLISKCCRGKYKHGGGFRWEYARNRFAK